METPVSAQSPTQSAKDGMGPECEQSFSTTLDLGGHFLFEAADRVAPLGPRATADFAGSRWSAHHNRISGE